MKASRQQAAANHERILDTASRLFRVHGLDGVSVAGVMHDAGLTHGGFYGHFASKEALAAAACEHALAQSAHRWQSLCDGARGDPLAAVATHYLAPRHRDDPGSGCMIAALGTDMPRHAKPVRRSLTRGVRALVDVLADALRSGSRAARRRKALATYASLLGALVLARAVDDDVLSAEILDAVSASIGSRGDGRAA